MRGFVEALQHRAGQRVGDGELPAVPAWQHGVAGLGDAHIGGQPLGAHQLQRAAAEQEHVTRLQPRDEALLTVAMRPPVRNCTLTDASDTMVPMLLRCRRASRASGTRHTPSSSGITR